MQNVADFTFLFRTLEWQSVEGLIKLSYNIYLSDLLFQIF